MSDFEELGTIEKSHEETEIDWKITDYFTVTENKNIIKSPTFSFANISWYLQLEFKRPAKPEFILLYLQKKGNLKYAVEYNFGLKKLNDNFEHLSKGIFKINNEWIGPVLMKHSVLQHQKSELVPSGVFIVACKLKRATTLSSSSSISKTEDFIRLDTLSENLKSLFANKDSCDTTLYVKNKEFKAHRALLTARSSVFAAMFLHETSEKQTGIVTIPDCDPDSFEQFLEFLYSGKLEKPSISNILHLYKISDKYDVQELKIFCSEFLMEKMTIEYLCDVVVLSEKYEDTKLLSAAQHFFNNNLSSVLVTPEWDCLLKDNRQLANKLLIEMSKMKDCN